MHMALAVRTRLGPYEIVATLGAGGMGEVYKARDTRLNRFVAIKILPPERVADAGRKQRFRLEAQAASALNHPNIISIYDIAVDNGRDYIVMEYVPGKTLDALIPHSGMRLGELLKIAIPVAGGLTAAHAAGIVHRDVKPSNVMVSETGLVKLLDFGLAKLTERGEVTEDASTLTLKPATDAGTVLGTAAYMSPEQADGQPLDARSDIFSFGAVLYEMATGHRAFAGESKAATLAAVLNKEPSPLRERAPEVPAELERVILRCLRKDPDKRQQHMVDVKVLLEELREESEPGKLAAVEAQKKRRWPWVTAAALIIAAAGAGLWLWRGREEPSPRVVPLTTFAGIENFPSFSPDGNQVVFAWDGEKHDNVDLYVKLIGSPTALRLTTDRAPDSFPAWSRDGRQIAFLKNGQPPAIFLISPLGGPEQKLVDFDAAPGAPAWSPDGKFLVVARSSLASRVVPPGVGGESGALYLVPLQGGELRPILVPDSGRYHLFPAFDPAGRSLAFASCGDVGPSCDISLVALNTDFVPQNRPRRIRRVPAGLAGLAWAADGRTLVYSAGTSINDYFLWRLNVASGEAKRLETASVGAMFPAAAWKGRRLAFARQVSDQDIWRVEAGAKPEPFLASTMLDNNAQFSPDGQRIAFSSARGVDRVAIWLSDAGGANLVQLTRGPGTYDGSPRWSPDGRCIAFDALGSDGRRSVHIVESTGGQSRHLTTGFPWINKVPSWSRDGKWIYFTSDRTGRWEIWRIPAQGGATEQITSNGGYVALESADGNTLYYTKTGSYGVEPLYAHALGGSEERQVLERVAGRGFDVFEDGIYYLTPSGHRTAEIRFHEFATGRSRVVSAIDALPGLGLSVSPNRRTFLFAEFVSAGVDLMLIDNFR
jgi:Tol biopolymer transport system component